MATTSERPLRKDAERNRRRILDAARVLFAQRGLGVSLDEIARQADVGVGTVYRRFPDKDQLIDALFAERVGEILALAKASLEISDPWAALVHFLEHVIELQVEDRGLKQLLLGTAKVHAQVECGRRQIHPVVEALLSRAQRSGAVREDLTVPDLILLQHAISEVAEHTRKISPEVWRRTMLIVLDGLRPDRRRPSPMPVPPLDDDQVVAARILAAAGPTEISS